MRQIDEIIHHASIFIQETKIKAMEMWIKLLEGKKETKADKNS